MLTTKLHKNLISLFLAKFLLLFLLINTNIPLRAQSWSNKSVLSSGTWYKIAVTESGIYRIDRQLLNKLGVNSNTDPNHIKVYGNGGAMLPLANDEFYPDDLMENNVWVSGGGDGQFNQNDYILFYAQGPHTLRYDKSNGFVDHELNHFADSSYYFLTIENSEVNTIEKKSFSGAVTYTSNECDIVRFHEVERRTDISDYVKSGRNWYGEEFSFDTEQEFEFTSPLNINNMKVKIRAAHRSAVPSQYLVRINNANAGNISLSNVRVQDYEAPYVSHGSTIIDRSINSTKNVRVELEYIKNRSDALGWLDFITVNMRVPLNYPNNQLYFTDIQSVGNELAKYNISGSAGIKIWDVTNPYEIYELENDGSGFTNTANDLRHYVLFKPEDAKRPEAHGIVKNQNLHGIEVPDMLIVAHPSLLSGAMEIAEIHEQHDGIKSFITSPRKIYNEYSSGKQDIAAIRNFARHLYSKNPEKFKFLLFVGDASYDYKNRLSNNSNLVPTFQTVSSHDPIESWATDDFFGFLEENEGDLEDAIRNRNPMSLDISIGRIIASSLNEVRMYANKMLDYYNISSQSSWRNKLVMVADDEDGGRYMTESEDFSKYFDSDYPEFNIKKIYSDAFKQEITANGAKYPEVNKTLNREVNDGALLVNYIGHGGETGWAEEGILTLSDIRSWKNNNALSIFVTATCEFTRFDDPGRVSAGEEVLLNDRGGAIVLLSTTRLVFAGSNKNLLNRLFRNNFFEKKDGTHKTIGEIVRVAKNRYMQAYSDENVVKFVIFGSPAITPAFPEKNVVTTSINSVDINDGTDTLKALERVYIAGGVVDEDSILISDFNGTVNISIFDKPVKLQTLKNDPGSRVTSFESYQSLIYRGQAKVSNGRFEANFVVPKDIAYNIGDGKISYYASAETQDAHGVNFVPVGGTSDNPITDNIGPEVEVFMNDTNFRFGGTVNADPFLIARIYDDNGINTVSNSIGHEPRAYLDNNEPVVFTNEFTTDLGDTRKGRINYQFFDLEEGRHRIKVVVYDVANNKGEGYTEFIVAGSNQVAIDNLLSFPNPFTSYTTFKFEHNRPDEVLNAEIQIFSSMGQLVRTIKGNINSPASVSQEFTWDGRSDYGGEVEPGVYIYRLLLTTNDGQFAKESSRVVFIK